MNIYTRYHDKPCLGLIFASRMLALAVTAVSVALLSISAARAGSGTWIMSPTNSDWNTASNWSSNTVPADGDIATFASSNIDDISLTMTWAVNGIVFQSGADPYEITAFPGQTFT